MSQPLLNLEIRTTCNTAEEDLISNLQATKARKGLKWLGPSAEIKAKPLVICGSGPSAWAQLASLSRETYDLMALNGSYGALLNAGYVPNYYAQIDARAFNKPFVVGANNKTKFLLAAQVHPDVFDALEGYDVEVFQLNTNTDRKVFENCSAVFVGCPAGTVGMCAMALAGLLGYRTLILIGYDSSYTAEASHMVHQPQNVGQAVIQVEFDGRWYLTTPTLADQVMEFFEWNRSLRAAFPGMEIHVMGSGLFYDYIVTNQNIPPCTTTREEELARYPQIYADDPEYRCTDIRLEGLQAALTLCRKPDAHQSYLDVSCGRGESLALAERLGFSEVKGTETVPALIGGRVAEAILPNTGLPEKSFDVVSLIEVIEHLVPSDVEPALHELERLAKEFIIISAATFPSWKNGANLHPSARPESEWNRLFQRVWGSRVKKLDFAIHPSPAWLVDLRG